MGQSTTTTRTATTDAIAHPFPPCYEAYLPGVAARINVRAATCADGFWFLADPHFPKNAGRAGAIIAALSRQVPIDKVFSGGDIPYAYVADGRTPCRNEMARNCDDYRHTVVEPVRKAGLRLFTARGNHDFTICADRTLTGGCTLSGEETRRLILGEFTESNVVANESDPEACCYFFDNAAAKVRYVVADTTDSAEVGDAPWGVRAGMREPQTRWLAEKALGTLDEGWGVVFVHHEPVASVVGWDEDAAKFVDFRRLLEAYQNRECVALFGKNYDFTGTKGRILLSLTGHYHSERQTFQRGILHVTTPCDMLDLGIDYQFGTGPWCGNLPDKREGGIYEHTFDAVQLDTTRGLVHFTRVGGGQDRTIHLTPVKVGVGQRTALETKHLVGPLTWGCHDADRVRRIPSPRSKFCSDAVFKSDFASIANDGTLAGLRRGEAVAIAMDADFNKEIWPVSIL